MIAISSLRRAAIAPANAVARRHLSFACASSVNKLNDIFEQYRQENYSQEFPGRFQKDIVKAATINSPSTRQLAVSADGIWHVLQNVGMGHRIARSEIDEIVSELGECPRGFDEKSSCAISADQMLRLMSKNWA